MTGDVPLVISGVIPRQPDELQLSLTVPTATEADGMRSSVAIWLDSVYLGAMNDIGSWRSVDPERLPAQLRGRVERAVQFAFTATGTELPPIGLTLQQRQPRLAAAALTTIIAKDTAVEYSIACKWKITRAAADTFSFTTPSWLSGKMDFEGTGYRQITEAPAGDDRIRWTVELDDPRRDEFFVVANVTLPPPADAKIVAPTIRFEETQPNDDGTISQLETQTEYLILVNQSRGQLDLATTDAVESTSADEVRIINLPESLLQQAVNILRVTQPDTTVTWNVQTLQRIKSLPASVNLADNRLVIARDGSWRAQASYRINNRSRQFLALVLPAEARILSVFVAGKPSRPVQTTKEGKQLTLIALPKTLAADFSFTADIVSAGRSPQRLPTGLRATAADFDLPHADVLTPKEDEEFGIPVSKTNWTVYLPEDIDASVIDDPARSNLKRVTTVEHRYDLGVTLMKEAEEVLSTALEKGNVASRYMSKAQLKSTEQQIDAYNRDLNEQIAQTDDKKKQAELQNQQARLRQKFEETRRKIEAEQQARGETSQSQTGRLMIGAGVNSDRGLVGNSVISSELVNSNSGDGVFFEDADNVFEFEVIPNSEIQAGKEASIEQRRGKLQEQVAEQKGALNKDRNGKQEALLDVDEASIPPLYQPQDSGVVTMPLKPGDDAGGGFSHIVAPIDALIAEQWILGAGRGEELAREDVEGEPQPEDQPWTAAGGLSLLIDVPKTGQQITLSKVGGGPMLAMSLRPQETRDTLFDVAWLIVWAGLGLCLVLALRRPTASTAVWRLLPAITMVAGSLWYFLLPVAPIGFCIVMLGAVWLAVRHRHATA